jgi:hypothetical protein
MAELADAADSKSRFLAPSFPYLIDKIQIGFRMNRTFCADFAWFFAT